jgi:cobalamin synthase
VPRSLRIATRLTNNLPNISEFTELPQGQIGRLYLEGNEAILQFSSALQGPSDIRLTIVTQNVDAPAILTFAQENAARAAGMIATVNSDRQRLDTVYANVPLYLAAQIASERLVSLYSTVDILGFSLARENLPWGILIIMITLLGASFITLRKALSHSLKIVSKVVSEDAFDILLDSMIGRVAIWIIVPLLAIAASLPSSPFTEMEIILLILGVLLSLLLGYRCVLLSNKL